MRYGRTVTTNVVLAIEHVRIFTTPVLPKINVDNAAGIKWSYLYTYFFGHVRFMIITLQKIVLNNLVTTNSTTLTILIMQN